jgi:Pectate lyase superfamily protein
MAIQTPFVTPFVSIRDFGAVPDDLTPEVRAANSQAFVQAQAAMKSDPNAFGHPLFVPSGTFYLADDLHISKSLELFGTGIRGESILMFPEFKSLIIDPGNADPTLDGAESMIRDLQIISEENWTTTDGASFIPGNFDPDPSDPIPDIFKGTSKGTPGIKMHRTATIQRVYIKGFTGTGVYIIANGDVFNANQWRIHDVYINTCGGHGIHVNGGEAQGGLCTGTKIIVVGGSAIYESSFGGNTYVGCYVEVVKGRGYISDSVGQTTFVACFSEANEPNRLSAGGNVWVGGSSAGFTDDTTAFIAEGYGNVHPFEVPNLKELRIRLLLGYPNDGTDSTTICAWANNNAEFYVMRWDMDNKIWTIENGSVLPVDGKLPPLENRNIAYYLTGNGHPRGPWLQGFGEMLLGPADSPIKIRRGDQPATGTGEPGDIVYNTKPQVGGYIGYVCDPTREWRPFGKIEA